MQHNNSITQYSNSKYYLAINESKIDDIFESVYTTIVSDKQKYLGKSLGWIIDSVFSHLINISKCNLWLVAVISDYIYAKDYIVQKKTWLIFKISVINNALKCLTNDIKFLVKVRNIQKIGKKKQSALVFLVIKMGKNIQSMCQKTL